MLRDADGKVMFSHRMHMVIHDLIERRDTVRY
jgi:hypothetical protein